jgi:hypothetical protein
LDQREQEDLQEMKVYPDPLVVMVSLVWLELWVVRVTKVMLGDLVLVPLGVKEGLENLERKDYLVFQEKMVLQENQDRLDFLEKGVKKESQDFQV